MQISNTNSENDLKKLECMTASLELKIRQVDVLHLKQKLQNKQTKKKSKSKYQEVIDELSDG